LFSFGPGARPRSEADEALAEALKAIQEIGARHHLPELVPGTILYHLPELVPGTIL
jgi:tRNA A37 N6-isopentenylltransferase MiaA